MVQKIFGDDCGCGPGVPMDALPTDQMIEEAPMIDVPIQPKPTDVPATETFGAPISSKDPSLLKRFANWLSSSDQA